MSEFLSFAKKLKCPLCNSQLDGSLNKYGADLYCVSSPEEYSAKYDSKNSFPYYESIAHYDNIYEYRVHISYNNENFITNIDRYDLSYPSRLKRFSNKSLVKNYNGRLMNFTKKLNAKELQYEINKILIFN